MWFDLNRLISKHSLVVAAVVVSYTASPISAQEVLPVPGGQVDPDASTPFGDDQPNLVPPAARSFDFNAMGQNDAGFRLFRPDTLDRLHRPLLRQDLTIEGARSCAISNCHGGPRPGVAQPWARRGMEYILWAENDPHAQSWRTICSDESVDMMRRLNIMQGDEIVDQAGFDNCLACHNTTKRYNEPRRRSEASQLVAGHIATPHSPDCNCGRCRPQVPGDVNSFLREGVGCAGCHGPSEQWIYTHFQYGWSSQGATDQGFVEAGNLYVRARMCATCHVGDKDRDMNHDIIAAGHPALRYELATFHAWQPKHWRDAEAEDKTKYEAQLWLAGQVAATDASLALLEARTADAHSVSEWPEFAAYDCASCHHNLGLDNSRRPLQDARNATAIYSQWNDAGLRWLIQHRVETGEATEQDQDLVFALDQVKLAMERRPKPNPEEVADASILARQSLSRWFEGAAGMRERHGLRSDRLGRVVASAAGKRETFRTWESAAQFYLAAVAARESWPGSWNGPLRNVADRMQFGLRYPEMIDVSRYAKRDSSGPTLSRAQAMALGIELAGWLGPVQAEMIFDQDDDEVMTPQLREQLRQMTEEINARWQARADQRASEAPQPADEMGQGLEDEVGQPQATPKTREELLEELRQRQEAGQQDPSGDET